jgi:glycosyltransferase involved in cell wall biosynthesis
MRILFLTTNPALEASTRYRVLQYFPALRRAGHQPEVASFFEDWAGSGPGRLARARRVARGLWRRVRSLRHVEDYDVVVVHRELLPYCFNYPVGLVTRRRPLVFDFDDAVWLAPPSTKRSIAPRSSTALLVKHAASVLAGNSYLAEYARRLNSSVEVIPTVVDTSVYHPGDRPPEDPPVIGWIGSPTTVGYLDPIVGVLEDLARSFRFRFRVIGAELRRAPSGVPLEIRPWTADDEADQFRDLDIGIYPLPDDRWTRGKCGLKAIQYLASGVAAVVSPVGVVQEIVENERTGLWATSATTWRKNLGDLLADPQARRRLGGAGRLRIQGEYSLAAWAPRVIERLEKVGRDAGH